MTEGVTVIDLIRHGEPVGGVLIRGSRDDPLSDKGWRQMWQAVAGKRPWEVIVSSPMERCAAFAHRLAAQQRVPVIELEGLREIGFGEWEGKDPARLYADDPQAVSGFWADPAAHPPPGGEPLDQFESRVTGALESITSGQSGRQVLVVAHGGVIRLAIARILGMPVRNMFRMEVPYAAATRVRIEDGQPRLSFHCGRF